VACAQQHQKNLSVLAKNKAIIQQTVLLNNETKAVPILNLVDNPIVSVNLGYANQSVFDSLLNKYADVHAVTAQKYTDSTQLYDLEDDLKYYKTVIVALDLQSLTSKNLSFINDMAKDRSVILAAFGDQSMLARLNDFHIPLLWSPTDNPAAAAILPQFIFGGIGASALLEANYSANYQTGMGFRTEAIRLQYSVPEDVGVNSDDLTGIDQIAHEAISGQATPGLVVLVAKDGKVIYNKSFGSHTYDKKQATQISDIFDFASVTKITATTPSVMRLVEEGELNLDTNIGYYIAKARNTPMNTIKVREVMLHQAGFVPYIPFHNFIKEGDYSRDSSAAYPTKVADNYYIKSGFFNDFMWPKMLNSPIKTRGKYVYSDISMYVMEDIIEHISKMPEDSYVQVNFYQPLGMKTAGFLPRNRFPKSKIVPTEDDQKFRKTLLEGYVHDQGAALKGGVAGHAGLFGTANDLAIYDQMLLNKGSYGGTEYFKPSTVEAFTSKQSNVSRRGLGFDRWDPDLEKEYPSKLASPQTFGHTGYTGIASWVDPARNLVYVFLSNRVNPQVSSKLLDMNIRPRIQDVINKAIDKASK
jgi:CubicO group peptidase (beta-lactamase class C family)